MKRLAQSSYSIGRQEGINSNKQDNSPYNDGNMKMIKYQKTTNDQSDSLQNIIDRTSDVDGINSHIGIQSNQKLASISNRLPINSSILNDDVEVFINSNTSIKDNNLIKQNGSNLNQNKFMESNEKGSLYQSYDVIINSPQQESMISPNTPFQEDNSQVEFSYRLNKLERNNQQDCNLSNMLDCSNDLTLFQGQNKQKCSDNEFDVDGSALISNQMSGAAQTIIQLIQDKDCQSISKSQYSKSQRNKAQSSNFLKSKNDFLLKQIKEFKNNSTPKRNSMKNYKSKNTMIRQHDDRTNILENSGEVTIMQPPTQYSNKNYLVVLLFVKKFVNSLFYSIASKDYRLLQTKHYQIINDKSVINGIKKQTTSEQDEQKTTIELYSYFRNKKKTQLHKRNIKTYIDKIKSIGSNVSEYIFSSFIFNLTVLQPNSFALILWDILLLFQLSLLFIIVPVRLAFDITNISESQWQLFNSTIPLIVFIGDMIIGLHSGYYEYGLPVLDKKRVTIRYLKNKFWNDFLCIFLILIDISDVGYLITLFLRFNQAKLKAQKINEHFQLQERFPTSFDFSLLIIRVLYVSHLFGCGFNFIGIYTQNEITGCWLIKNSLMHKHWIEHIITMITIGYGDIYPVNVYEKVYVIIMTFISCGLFAYCVNSIGEIFREIKQKSVEFTQKKYVLSSYLNHMNISNHTKIRFLKYTEYIHHTTDQLYIKGQQIFDSCPQEMREEVLKEYYGKKLLHFKAFKLNFSTQFLVELSLKMKEQSLGPGESIVFSGSRLSKLYFINKISDLEYYYTNGDFHRSLNQVSQHNQYDVVDLGLFFSDQPSIISIKTKTSTTVSYISKEDFLEVIRHFQIDFERYSMMRSQFLNESRCDNQCSCCGKFSHNIANCPLIHYSVQKELLTARLFAPCIQERDPAFVRRKFRADEKFHTMSLNYTVKHELKRARLNFARERHSFLNDPEVLQTFQFHTQDKQFFQQVPQILLIQTAEENSQTGYVSTYLISNKLTGVAPLDYQTSIYMLTSESQTDSEFSDSNDSSIKPCRQASETAQQIPPNDQIHNNLNYSISEQLEGNLF